MGEISERVDKRIQEIESEVLRMVGNIRNLSVQYKGLDEFVEELRGILKRK